MGLSTPNQPKRRSSCRRRRASLQRPRNLKRAPARAESYESDESACAADERGFG
jgi:hypothetical protein